MNRRDILGVGAIAMLPQLYPARAEGLERVTFPEPIPSRMEYRILDFSWRASVENCRKSLTEIFNDQGRDGFELIAVDQTNQYIFGKRVPLEPSA